MLLPSTKTPGNVEVLPALPDQEPILANLLELYAHDFSEFCDIVVGDDGKFGYPHLPLYWSEPGRYPFLVRSDGQIAGFVLVKQDTTISGGPAVWDLAEFFVLRTYRRRGIGTFVAQQIWSQFRGTWKVRVMEANPSARRFWEHSISQFTGEEFASSSVKQLGRSWCVFSFKSVAALDASSEQA